MTQKVPLKWTLVSCVNNEAVLQSCLLNSSSSVQASEIILQRGFSSAALAYNNALDKATTDVVVFAHQDVFLPQGWEKKLQCALERLSLMDSQWGVAGVWGVQSSGHRSGHLYCVGLGAVLGDEACGAAHVRTLDELLLIVRKSSRLRFDERLTGFHWYATDICMEAQRQGMKCYAISTFCIHNTNGYNLLPWQFWSSYLFMRKKWRAELPITSPCAEVTPWCWPMIRWNIVQVINLLLKRHNPGRRVEDPRLIYQDLLRSGRITAKAHVG